jgi:hypothetical protein
MVVIKDYISGLNNTYFKRNFSVNYSYIVISLLIGISIGLLLGLEHFIIEIRKEGRMKLNFPKLIFIGLPALYTSLGFLWIYSGIFAYPLIYLFRYGSGCVPTSQLILGYIVITSFYKINKQN